ncbi:hypothetical protein [Mycobacterium sp.]|uniref:hypothetical protein n=1 Tax=Mycobacterium sp. TaxID=1785 RepID=UPI003A887A99
MGEGETSVTTEYGNKIDFTTVASTNDYVYGVGTGFTENIIGDTINNGSISTGIGRIFDVTTLQNGNVMGVNYDTGYSN